MEFGLVEVRGYGALDRGSPEGIPGRITDQGGLRMCYGCSPTCDNCRPKMVRCAACERINYLNRTECTFCGAPITQAMKDAAVEDWKSGLRMTRLPE